jgi:hypothetical protein
MISSVRDGNQRMEVLLKMTTALTQTMEWTMVTDAF